MGDSVRGAVTILTIASAVALLTNVARLDAQATCYQGRPNGQLTPTFGNFERFGTSQVQVFITSSVAEGGNLLTEEDLQEAMDRWNTACTQAQNAANIPKFQYGGEFGEIPTPRDPYTDGAPITNWKTTLGIEYLRNVPIQPGKGGGWTFAHWDPDRNVIQLYDVVPNNADLGSIPTRCIAGTCRLKWSSDWGRNAITHEFGHAMGLEHDRGGQACTSGGTDISGVMTDPVPTGSAERNLSLYCDFLSRINDSNEPCNDEQTEDLQPGETNACEQDEPAGTTDGPHAGNDICIGNDWLCLGGSTPWSAHPHACSPGCTYRTETVEVADTDGVPIGTTIYVYSTCGCGTSLVPQVADLAGPLVFVDSPVPGQEVSGLLHVQGWAMSFLTPVDLTAGVDGAQVAWQSLQSQIPDQRACSREAGGSGSWNCRSTAGFDGVLDTRMFPNGPHEIRLSAMSAVGVPTIVKIPVVISNCGDNESPTASLYQPTQGSTLSGNVVLAASATDNVSVSRVDFRVNGVTVATDSSAPYSATWSSQSVANGSHTIRARAIDGCGNQFTSPPVTVTVSNAPTNTPPQVWIDAPTANQVVTSRYLSWYGWATDAGSVSNLEFRLDGVIRNVSWSWGSRPDVCSAVPLGDPRCPNVGWGGTLDLYGVAPGNHTISVTAYDALGLSTTQSRVIQISNSGANAAFLSPSPGRSVFGNRVTFAGWATDSDGIESVRIEVDGVPASMSAPWSRIPWSGICSVGSPIDPACPNVGIKAAFDSTSFPDGLRNVRVIFRDSRGFDSFLDQQLYFRNSSAGTLISRSAIDDTYVRSSVPTGNYGQASTIEISAATGNQQYGLMKFDLSGISGQLRSARLKIVPIGASASRLNLFWITGGSWTEGSVTWNGLSGLTFSLFDAYFDIPANASGPSIDVTDAVSLGGTLSLGFTTESGIAHSIGSAEHPTVAFRPVLEIRKQ